MKELLKLPTGRQFPIKNLKNKRGLFLSNITSKTFEKIVDSKIHINYDSGQNGGRKHRGPIDSWVVLIAMRDRNRYLKKNTYLYFGDLVKCFDRLWLRDCIIDMWKAGMREREAKLIYLFFSYSFLFLSIFFR